jgi:hypothetical protein
VTDIILIVSGKSVCTVIAPAKWEWFQQWQDERVKKRGEDYDAIKTAIARRMWDHVLAIYPHLADKVISTYTRAEWHVQIRTPQFLLEKRKPLLTAGVFTSMIYYVQKQFACSLSYYENVNYVTISGCHWSNVAA